MGARQSRRSVDITTTPKKDSVPKDGESATTAEAGSAVTTPAEKIEKLGSIEEAAVAADQPAKPTSNGTGPHTESTPSEDKDEASEKDKAKEKSEESKEEVKPEEAKSEDAAGASSPGSEVTTPTEAASPASPANPDDTPNTKAKKKEKSKKKWSFRSISFSRKDKSKPVRESASKNGDVAKEEPLAEGGEEAEAAASTEKSVEETKDASAVVASPDDEKKPVEETKPAKAEEPAKVVAAEEPVAAKKEEPAVSSSPAVADKKDESDYLEPEVVAAGKVEVVATENGISDDVPKGPPPAVPQEAVQTAPAITEDVASVTKAIEEIDISDKAVAAGMNIENVGINEIVADSVHQNNSIE